MSVRTGSNENDTDAKDSSQAGPSYTSLGEDSMPRCCKNCALILKKIEHIPKFWRKTDGWKTHHNSVFELYEGAANTCWICVALWKEWSYHGKLDLRLSSIDQVRTSFSEYRFTNWTNSDEILEIRRKGGKNGVHFKISLFDSFPEQSKRSVSTSSDESRTQVLEWIKICQNSHGKCNDGLPTNWLPTRLLDVGMSPNDNISLVDTITTTIDGSYVTLSHCWGTQQPTQLNSTSEFTLRRGYKPCDLPPTFNDAVTIAQWLGIRYLWIDSMCIFQDSEDDWRRECSKMHEVYANAFCTLAATASQDGKGGMFRERAASSVNPYTIEKIGHLSSRKWATVDPFWGNRLNRSPLNCRGWVLQERILSRCVLHFCDVQIYWECYELDACEQFPRGLDRYFPSFEFIDPRGFWDSDPENSWKEIIRQFAACELTRGDDKLIAVSGLAKQLSRRMGTAYIAGLWLTPSLPHHLLWAISTNSRIKPSRQKEYRAPSWSWAAVDGVISFPFLHDPFKRSRALIQDHSAQTVPLGNDPMGQVADGWLKLRGTIVEIEGKGSFQLDIPEEVEFLSGAMFSLPVLKHKFASSSVYTVFYLILVRAPGRPNGYYRRIGILHESVWDWDVAMAKRNCPTISRRELWVPPYSSKQHIRAPWKWYREMAKIKFDKMVRRSSKPTSGESSLYMDNEYGMVTLV